MLKHSTVLAFAALAALPGNRTGSGGAAVA
jgi:hypothetical protein